MTRIRYKCAVDCTTLGRNAVNLNLTFKAKPQIWSQMFGNFWKTK